MRLDRTIHQRQALRLRDHDYSEAGAYYVTVCAKGRECLLGDVTGDNVELSGAGLEVLAAWKAPPDRFPAVALDEIVIMPNHVHAIIILSVLDCCRDPGTQQGTQQAASLPTVMRAFKSISALAVNRLLGRAGVPLWQERYYDHVIRDGIDWERIRTYIRENPARWAEDTENPARDAAT